MRTDSGRDTRITVESGGSPIEPSPAGRSPKSMHKLRSTMDRECQLLA